MDKLELICFEIITNVGSARSFYIEAISLAKNNKFIEARKSIKDGEEIFIKAHKAHAKLIEAETSGEKISISLVLVHAEDQLISADSFKIIATEFVDLYEKIDSKL